MKLLKITIPAAIAILALSIILFTSENKRDEAPAPGEYRAMASQETHPSPEKESKAGKEDGKKNKPEKTHIEIAMALLAANLGDMDAAAGLGADKVEMPASLPEGAAEFFRKGMEIAAMLVDNEEGEREEDGKELEASGEKGGFVCTDAVFEGKVGKGETMGKILENAADGPSAHYVKAAGKVFSFRAFREGQPYVVTRDAQTGKLKRFEYEINDSRRLVVEGLENPKARLEPIEYAILLESVEGVVSDNLFQAVADIGENPQLAFRLVKLFGSEINFIRDLQEGDSFAALVEKRYRHGDYKGYGRILAARFTNKGKSYEAFLFRDKNGRAAYYNAKGENLHKTLLQSPLAVTRMTSRFSHSRMHPILGKARPHLGVDYGAPTGTPVKAVGEGTVTKRGWGGGYGNQIILKHAGGLESQYAHLSGFARGLREGQRVSQGQVIGFVGSTGLSTGPHLDFRLRQNGKFIDPTKAINPRGLPVSDKMMAEFKKVMELERACLDGEKKIENYKADSIVPPSSLLTREVTAQKKAVKSAAKKNAKKRLKVNPRLRRLKRR